MRYLIALLFCLPCFGQIKLTTPTGLVALTKAQSTSTPAFHPSDIPGLSVFLTWSQFSTFANNQAITSWTNAGTYPLIFNETTSGTAKFTNENSGGVAFYGVGGLRSSTSFYLTNAFGLDNGTVIVRFKRNNASLGGIWGTQYGTGIELWSSLFGDFAAAYGSLQNRYRYTTNTVGVYANYGFIRTPTALTMYVNGSGVLTNSTTETLPTGNQRYVEFGTVDSSYPLNGVIKSLCIYSNAISIDDYRKVEQWMTDN